MLILTLRTDKPEAEVGLYEDQAVLHSETWHAHRALSATLHTKIKTILEAQGKTPTDIKGIVVFVGPGSFTGLRIGLTVANTLSYSLGVPIVGASAETWITEGIAKLQAGTADTVALPVYGAPVHITQQKK